MWEGKAAQLSSVGFAGGIWKGKKHQVFMEVAVNNHIDILFVTSKTICSNNFNRRGCYWTESKWKAGEKCLFCCGKTDCVVVLAQSEIHSKIH